jgi:DNA-binding MarR family transcriptional regulator
MPRDAAQPGHVAAWRAILTVHAELTERIDRALAEGGAIPLHWYDALLPLHEAPGHRLRLGELAHAALLSRSGLSRLVDRLEGAGMLEREACADDARGSYAVLTSAGQAALRKAWRIYGREIQRLFGRHVSSKEAAAMTAVLRRIQEASGPAK